MWRVPVGTQIPVEVVEKSNEPAPYRLYSKSKTLTATTTSFTVFDANGSLAPAIVEGRRVELVAIWAYANINAGAPGNRTFQVRMSLTAGRTYLGVLYEPLFTFAADRTFWFDRQTINGQVGDSYFWFPLPKYDLCDLDFLQFLHTTVDAADYINVVVIWKEYVL